MIHFDVIDAAVAETPFGSERTEVDDARGDMCITSPCARRRHHSPGGDSVGGTVMEDEMDGWIEIRICIVFCVRG